MVSIRVGHVFSVADHADLMAELAALKDFLK